MDQLESYKDTQIHDFQRQCEVTVAIISYITEVKMESGGKNTTVPLADAVFRIKKKLSHLGLPTDYVVRAIELWNETTLIVEDVQIDDCLTEH